MARRHFAILMGITTFVSVLTALYYLTRLNTPQAAPPSIIVALEVGWFSFDPRYWLRAHAHPFVVSWTWLVGEWNYEGNAYEKMYGASWIVLIGSMVAAPLVIFGVNELLGSLWLLDQSWYLWMMTRFAEDPAMAHRWIGILSVLAVAGLTFQYAISIVKEGLPPLGRFVIGGGVLGCSLLIGAIAPLAVGVGVIMVGAVLLLACIPIIVGTTVLMGSGRMFAVSAGIITGSGGSYLIAGMPVDLVGFLWAVGVGAAIGSAVGEGLHRVGRAIETDEMARDMARWVYGQYLVPRIRVDGRMI